jgi:hypothetical protein
MNISTEFLEVSKRFQLELLRSGVAPARAAGCTIALLDALGVRDEGVWTHFYCLVALALAERAERGPLPLQAEGLIRLLEDDLGSRVVDAALRERITGTSVEPAVV